MNQFMFDLGDETMGQSFPIAVSEQPPQQLENFGVNAVSDTELLAMILQETASAPSRRWAWHPD